MSAFGHKSKWSRRLPLGAREDDRGDCCYHRIDEHDTRGCTKCFCEWWRQDEKANANAESDKPTSLHNPEPGTDNGDRELES